ncbi:MAG: PAS domain S-box protein [Nitrospinae bacterium]|nr:PAS domain S-box protein [Nitrospinota bacterium]
MSVTTLDLDAAIKEMRLETETFLEASRAVLKYGDFKDSARAIFDSCKKLTGAAAGYVALLSENGNENEVLFLDAGGRECTVDTSLPMPIRGLRGKACATSSAVFENDFTASEWMKYMPQGHVRLENALFAPLNIEGKTVGILGLANKPGGFTKREADIASAFGELAAVALHNSRMLDNLKSSHDRFVALAQTAVDAIITMDSKGTILFWNDSAERMFGHSAGEVIGQPSSIIMPGHLRDKHLDDLKRLGESVIPLALGNTVELTAAAKDGREFPVEASMAAWRNKKEVYITGVFHDITRRKADENELRKFAGTLEEMVRERTRQLEVSNEMLKAEILARELGEERHMEILQAATDGFCLCGRNGDILEVNGAFLRMTGRGDAEILQMRLSDLQDAADSEQTSANVRKAMETGCARFETRFLKKGGGTVEVEATASYSPTLEESVVIFMRDISDRKAAEQDMSQMMAAFEQAVESIMITSASGVIRHVNSAFEKLTGYSRDEVLGRKPDILKSGKHGEQFYRTMWDTILRGNIWSGLITDKRKDGAMINQEMMISPVAGETGKITSFVAVSRDITAEMALKNAKDRFTTVTSHELRTPVSGLRLARALLGDLRSEGVAAEKLGEAASLLDRSIDGLERVLTATTLIQKLSAQAKDRRLIRFYPLLTALASVDNAKAAAAKSGRNLSIGVDIKGIPLDTEIMGDPEMLGMAIDQVLSNAIKYTPDGKSIHITARIVDGFAALEMKDEGIGMDKDKLDHVFEHYYSLGNPVDFNGGEYAFMGGGLGLGLALCRMIMEFHGGRITVESEGVNKGSAVTFFIPVADRKPY